MKREKKNTKVKAENKGFPLREPLENHGKVYNSCKSLGIYCVGADAKGGCTKPHCICE